MNARFLLPLAFGSLVACGGRAADLVGDSPLAPAPSASPSAGPVASSAPTTPIRPPRPACGGFDAVVYEQSVRLLSSVNGPTGAATKLGVVTCDGMSIDALTVQRGGAIVALSREGKMARVDATAPYACTALPALPAPAAEYRGALAMPGSDDVLTLRLGTSAQYLADGAYHHELVRVTPETGVVSVVATYDDTMVPDSVQPWTDGRILLGYFSGRSVRTWEPWKTGALKTSPVDGFAQGRAAAVVPGGELLVVGDVHDAGRDSGPDALPTYRLTADLGSLRRGADVRLPGGSLFGVVMGGTACAFDR